MVINIHALRPTWTAGYNDPIKIDYTYFRLYLRKCCARMKENIRFVPILSIN